MAKKVWQATPALAAKARTVATDLSDASAAVRISRALRLFTADSTASDPDTTFLARRASPRSETTFRWTRFWINS
jgi:hypothetical protein